MHIVPDFVPGHDESRSMGAEDRIRRIPKVRLRNITDRLDNLICIMALLIPGKTQGYGPLPLGIGSQVLGIVPDADGRRRSGKHSPVSLDHGCLRLPLHPLKVGHCPAHAVRRKFDPVEEIGL